ncbi:MAG: Methionyl-tRNA formyltransferase [Parcubacteria group bacterium GW2011_GWA2_46_10]|nr:MAG: Methionyl-tRNA formyltransferase [Parcubacteria group bacterium GW2011_GWA2_46_10]
MKYVFFGTPEFAGIILRGLIEADMPPVAVVCNPDKPVGRKKLITPPITKQIAEQEGIKVFQPKTKKDLVALSPSLSEMADFAVVAAYAKIIPLKVINGFKLGIIGVHPSLLPKFRGPSPIQSVILSGKLETGTTLFMLDQGVDDGLILIQGKVNVENRNYEELIKVLGELSLKLLTETLPEFVSGKIKPVPQDENEVTVTNFFEPEAGLVKENDLKDALGGDEEKSSKIERMVRALNPEPGVYTLANSKRTKLLSVRKDGSKLVLEKIQKEGKTPQAFV